MIPGEIEPAKILQIIIAKKVPAIMSYLSKGKWHVAKVFLTDLADNKLKVASSTSQLHNRPINIRINQPVGISFKFGYGKFVFDTTVEDLEPPAGPSAAQSCGGTIVLAVPDRMEMVQRRSYFRIDVPKSLKVKVLLWHRKGNKRDDSRMQESSEEMNNCWQGRLMDISAGGAQVVIPHKDGEAPQDFKKGQFAGMRFTPMPYETPLMLNVQVRNVLPTADGMGTSLGLQFVGLEASSEGRRLLTRLSSIVERYYQINQSGPKHQDARQVSNDA